MTILWEESSARLGGRPEAPGVTVRGILTLDEVRSGWPELLSGEDALGSAVRWVHIADSERVGPLLEGGELVLSTGLSFRASAAAAGRFLDDLENAGAAGAIIELVDAQGRPDAAAVEVLRGAAAGRALPVVVLTRTIKFVRVTQVAHRLLVGEQLARVERARRVHEVFTQLSLEGASEQRIVDRTAELLGAAVVLEDVAHRVLAFNPAGTDAGELLHDWAGRARHVGYREDTGRRAGTADWLQTPVGVHGRRWGRLVVPGDLPNDADAAQVLERAGQALTLARMAGRDEQDLLQQAQAGLMHDLRQPHALDEREAVTRAQALGLEPSALYVPIVVRLDRLPGENPTGLQLRERALLEQFAALVRQARRSLLATGLQSGSFGVLLGAPARQLEDGILERIFGQLAEEQAPDVSDGRTNPEEGTPDWTAGVGRTSSSLLEAAAGLDGATQVADIAATLEVRQRRYYRFADIRLRGLMAALHSDARVKAFAEAELGPLLAEQDAGTLDFLELYLRHGGNKTSVARTGYLSRAALYARVANLQERLGVSLDDAESRAALHVALLWHRMRGQVPDGDALHGPARNYGPRVSGTEPAP
ncbi:PucR family transcriptional regulator [Arthrobacter sp. I2-34]|uniref:PucR family transcriptional regulator n=1 Tax=Arthrobacter hankyongi TaxID=2904801 RepID=A0ABS9L8R6_9MICC|nr:PucR family transcriptional regulator [Arthrobacter hankyongi]MCG2623064.1 PucR family transcriptional regulator [Arthrobacter hankyongi]